MKRFLLISLVLMLSGIAPAAAYELDLSADREIQKKYDANKLNEDMQKSSPDEIIKTNASTPAKVTKSIEIPKSSPVFDDDTPAITADAAKYKHSGVYIPKRTKFKVKSNQKITNWSGINSSLTFTTTAPVYKKSVSIPVGTVFKGTVSNVHQPQIAGNGALVEIKITGMNYGGKTIPVNGKITKAADNMVFFNNIKGERQYMAGVKKKINSADNFYSKSRNMSNKWSQNPIGTVLSPIPTITGFVGAAAATAVSPVTGLFEKGKNINLPAGTAFEIKLIEDAQM